MRRLPKRFRPAKQQIYVCAYCKKRGGTLVKSGKLYAHRECLRLLAKNPDA